MLDIGKDIQNRVEFIKKMLARSHSGGIVFGNSGGKDACLVGALCKMATDNVIGVMMPCGSKRSYGADLADAKTIAGHFNIECLEVDLTPAKVALQTQAEKTFCRLSDTALSNVNPRLRMTTLYLIAQSKNYLVAGTGNKSEIHLGYFTKWGDGAYDFNPISDLTATQVFQYLNFINAPKFILIKPPSAGLFDGQTDEDDMGMTYEQIDNYLTFGVAQANVKQKVDGFHNRTMHKRKQPPTFINQGEEN